jgi:hypothetical protein
MRAVVSGKSLQNRAISTSIDGVCSRSVSVFHWPIIGRSARQQSMQFDFLNEVADVRFGALSGR